MYGLVNTFCAVRQVTLTRFHANVIKVNICFYHCPLRVNDAKQLPMKQLTIPHSLRDARIVISNDDGIHAEGLRVLAEVMHSLCDDVWVVAPETEQSGAGHSLTLHQPLRVRQLEERRFAVSGTPTDCVLLAAQAILPKDKPISLLVSGINHGDNMAEHVTYSGTIAAAMEGTLLGIPSIAFSRAMLRDDVLIGWDTAAKAVRKVMRALQGYHWNEGTLLSVNIPDCAPHELRDIRPAVQGRRRGNDCLEERIDPRGRTYYWIGCTDYSGCTHEDTTDCALLLQNHITVTPISLNLTNHAMIETMQQQLARPRDAA
jgi:5'-nucleotidase